MRRIKKVDHAGLLAAAGAARSSAYAPYSKFKVGAALIDNKGRVFTGCNVENSSYGATTCAERSAIAAMVAAGGRSFSEIVVVTDTPLGCPPCGICRQILEEFSEQPARTKVHVANMKGIVKSFTLRQLLPNAFARAYLEE